MKIEKPKSEQPIPENARKVFEGVIFDVYQWEQEMFDGSFETFEKLKRNDLTNVIAFTEDGKVIVLEQEQPGKKKYLSLPGGAIEDCEDVIIGAERELLEETGYKAEKMKLWHSEQPISKIDYCIHFVIATNCKKIAEQNLESGEKITVNILEVDEFLEMIFSQKIKSSNYFMKFLEEDLIVIDKEKTFKKIKEYFN